LLRYSVGYADFVVSSKKGAIVIPAISGVTGPNVTKIVRNVKKFILFNLLKLVLQYCNPFWNDSATKKNDPRKTPIFFFNWLRLPGNVP